MSAPGWPTAAPFLAVIVVLLVRVAAFLSEATCWIGFLPWAMVVLGGSPSPYWVVLLLGCIDCERQLVCCDRYNSGPWRSSAFLSLC